MFDNKCTKFIFNSLLCFVLLSAMIIFILFYKNDYQATYYESLATVGSTLYKRGNDTNLRNDVEENDRTGQLSFTYSTQDAWFGESLHPTTPGNEKIQMLNTTSTEYKFENIIYSCRCLSTTQDKQAQSIKVSILKQSKEIINYDLPMSTVMSIVATDVGLDSHSISTTGSRTDH